MKIKVTYENFIYAIMAILVLLSVFDYTLISYMNNNAVFYMNVLGAFLRVLLVVATIHFYKAMFYSKKTFYLLVCLLIISIMIFWTRQTFLFFDLFYVSIICEKKLLYKKVINVFFYSVFIGIVVVLGLYFLDFFPEYYLYRDELKRYSFGFNHPNTFGRIVMLVILLWFIKKDKKINLGDLLIGFLGVICIYIYPNSVSSAISLLIITVILFVQLLWKTIYGNKQLLFLQLRKWLILVSIIICIAIIYYLVLYKNGTLFLGDFSDSFYTRFTYAYIAIKKYGWTFFGNPDVNFITSADLYFKRKMGTFFPFDLFYVYLPVVYGVVPALFFGYMYIRSLFATINKKKNVLLIIMLVFLVYLLMESAINTFCFSFLFILPFCIIEQE